MDRYPIHPDAVPLEDAFFAQEDARLLEKLRQQARLKERREALREVAPNADEALLDHLIALNIGPETVLALVLVPLAAVAWADGKLDDREREAILKAAADRGITTGSPAYEILSGWLKRPPAPRLIETWKKYITSTWDKFDAAQKRAMHDRMIGMAREVAQAAGGFLGLSRISAAERAVLDELEKTLAS